MSRVGLKICGITRPVDLRVCDDLGVAAVGINLWAGSRRGLSVAEAATLLATAPEPKAERIGVFVERSPDQVAEAMARLKLDALQWHGDASVQAYADLGLPYVWVVRGTPALDELKVPSPAPRWVLLDAAVPGYGGAGKTTDWAWAARAVEALAPLPVWLAGGLDPRNAARAIDVVGPAGLDVASGAESEGASHGAKDAAKIEALLHATRGGE